MKSILVGEHRGRKLYYLPESKSLAEDGALLNASGQIKIINFWKFARTKTNIDKILNTNFHDFFWNGDNGKSKKLWQETFITKIANLENEKISLTFLQNKNSARKNKLNQMSNRCLDFKINLNSQTIEEKSLRKIGRRIGRALTPKRRKLVGRRAMSRIVGEQNPLERLDADGDGLIFDGTWREMPAPRKLQGLRSENTEPSVLQQPVTATTSVNASNPGALNLPNLGQPQVGRLIQTVERLPRVGGERETGKQIQEWFREKLLAGINIVQISKKLKARNQEILNAFGVTDIKTVKEAEDLLSKIYPNYISQSDKKHRRSASALLDKTYFEFLWYDSNGFLKDENSELLSWEKDLLLSHLGLILLSPEAGKHNFNLVSATMSYKATKIFTEILYDGLTQGKSIDEIVNSPRVPDFIKAQIVSAKSKTEFIPVLEMLPNGSPQVRFLNKEDFKEAIRLNPNLLSLIQSLPRSGAPRKAFIEQLLRPLHENLGKPTEDSRNLGFVGFTRDGQEVLLNSDFLPVARKTPNMKTSNKKTIIQMYRDPSTDGQIRRNIPGMSMSGTAIFETYFEQDNISKRIIIAAQLDELNNRTRRTKLNEIFQKTRDTLTQLNKKQQRKTGSAEAIAEIAEAIKEREMQLQELENEAKKIDEDSWAKDINELLENLINLSAAATNFHEGGHVLDKVAMENDKMPKIKQAISDRIIELRTKKTPLTEAEEAELSILEQPISDFTEKNFEAWYYFRQHIKSSDEEILGRLQETETELVISGLFQLFNNLATPANISEDPRRFDITNQLLRRKNVVMDIVEKLKQNLQNRDPQIAASARNSLDEIIKAHAHKLDEIIIDPKTGSPIKISKDKIDQIKNENEIIIRTISQLNMQDTAKLISRLRELVPKEGDFTLRSLLILTARKQLLSRNNFSREVGESYRTPYNSGLGLGTDIQDPRAKVERNPDPYDIDFEHVVPKIAEQGFPQVFDDELNEALIRAIRAYSISHLGHYAEIIPIDPLTQKPKQLADLPRLQPDEDAPRTLAINSARYAVSVLLKTFKRLNFDNQTTKNNTVSSFLESMPNLGMINLYKLFSENQSLNQKAKQYSFAEIYNSLSPDEKIMFREAIRADSLQLVSEMARSRPEMMQVWLKFLKQDLLTILADGTNPMNNVPVMTAFMAIQSKLQDLTKRFISEGFDESFLEELILELKKTNLKISPQIVEQIRNFKNNPYLMDIKQKMVEVINANHGDEFNWDDLSPEEIDAIVQMVQRWGNDMGKRSYALHDYRQLLNPARAALHRLAQLGFRQQYAEIPSEINLVIETGIPFLLGDRQLTSSEKSALTKLVKWMRPNEKIAPEIKSLYLDRGNKWLL